MWYWHRGESSQFFWQLRQESPWSCQWEYHPPLVVFEFVVVSRHGVKIVRAGQEEELILCRCHSLYGLWRESADAWVPHQTVLERAHGTEDKEEKKKSFYCDISLVLYCPTRPRCCRGRLYSAYNQSTVVRYFADTKMEVHAKMLTVGGALSVPGFFFSSLLFSEHLKKKKVKTTDASTLTWSRFRHFPTVSVWRLFCIIRKDLFREENKTGR